MTEQADQQWPEQKEAIWPVRGSSVGRSKLSVTHQARTSARLHQDRTNDARLRSLVDWAYRRSSGQPAAASLTPPQNLRPLNRASSSTLPPAAAWTSLHDVTRLPYSAATIYHQQTRTISRPLSRLQTVWLTLTLINIVICVVLRLSLWTILQYPTVCYMYNVSCSVVSLIL